MSIERTEYTTCAACGSSHPVDQVCGKCEQAAADAALDRQEHAAVDDQQQAERKAEQAERPTALALSGNRLQVADHGELRRVAEFMHRSGLNVGGARTVDDVYAVLLAGYESGLSASQTMAGCMIVNGRVSTYGTTLWGQVLASGQLVKYTANTGEDDNGEMHAVVYATRRWPNGVEIGDAWRFTQQDAERAGLWGKRGPWEAYPQRMLLARARTYMVRDLFADIVGGLADASDFGVEGEAFDPSQARGAASASTRPTADALPEPEQELWVEVQDADSAEVQA